MSGDIAEKLNLRNGPVNQETFDLLPALLTAFQVKFVTGWSDNELSEAVRAGEVVPWQRPVKKGRKKAYKKYTKVSVAIVVGLKA